MADKVFSAARLRGYRVIEEEGLSDAIFLQILNTQLAAYLWLPLSLIEIAFRNVADRTISGAPGKGEDWLIDDGRRGDVLVAKNVRGPKFCHATRDDGTLEDPVGLASRMAARQVGRTEISRDDLIAHLMLGFWVVRVPEGLRASEGLGVFSLIAAELPAPLNDPARLERVMVNHVLRTRNRVAHHEPLLFRAKHVFSKAGKPKTGADLVTSLLGAIEKFTEEADLTVETAKVMAPMATDHLDPIPSRINAEVGALRSKLQEERAEIKRRREQRRAELR